MEDALAKRGTGGMSRQQWLHGDKEADNQSRLEQERERQRVHALQTFVKKKRETTVAKSRIIWQRSCPYTDKKTITINKLFTNSRQDTTYVMFSNTKPWTRACSHKNQIPFLDSKGHSDLRSILPVDSRCPWGAR